MQDSAAHLNRQAFATIVLMAAYRPCGGTMNIYGHVIPAMQEEAASEIDAALQADDELGEEQS